MKSLINKAIIFFFALGLSTSCSEEDFLKEEPLDFLSPENAFVSSANFESSVVDLYAKYRNIYYDRNARSFAHNNATDLTFYAREAPNNERFGAYNVTLNPTSVIPRWHWDNWYKIIANANTIINTLEGSDLSPEQQTAVEAEARLFRALAYRHLVYLYGGVPLLLEELKSPKSDYTRNSREEILNQIILDASFASENLRGVQEVQDGRLSNLVAYHLLAETYISIQDYDAAIAAATTVIDDPNTGLMLNRFGSRAGENPGDVYWDLFRRNNQNRASGNIESLWVAQMETDVLGGMINTERTAANLLERYHGHAAWTLNDPDGNSGFLGPRSDNNMGGRGTSFIRPTSFFENTLWESDFDNDIRNAPHNYVRDLIYDNPASAWFGQSARDNPGPLLSSQDWRWYPHLTKITTPGNHPTNLIDDPVLGTLKNSAGTSYMDQYYLRLAETYLIRAEAYLGNGDVTNAAVDINAVRQRSNATPVLPAEVDIDYILDERGRELMYEVPRRITLHRTGKLVERVRLYNDLNSDDIQDFHNLWPIPAEEIEANVNGNLEQNPGY